MTYMKILLLLMFCTVLPMQAQQMKKLTDLKDFEARLLQEAKNIESIESNFTQIKYRGANRRSTGLVNTFWCAFRRRPPMQRL